MTLALITLSVILATLAGGLFALRYSDRFHFILSFSAGAVLGISFFDLLPESIFLAEANYTIHQVITVTAIGFFLYMILNQWFSLHTHHDEDCENPHHRSGILGAGSLSIHSFLDGIAIGLAFQASPAVGAIVTAAVLAHDFSDGINTVSMILKHGGTFKNAFKWLLIDALAPALGIIATQFFTLEERQLSLLLALFTGFFLYIGASDLLPESHHKHPTIITSLVTILGAGFVYAVIQLAGH